jgi:TM2 domain-containing membrane protein YozV
MATPSIQTPTLNLGSLAQVQPLPGVTFGGQFASKPIVAPPPPQVPITDHHPKHTKLSPEPKIPCPNPNQGAANASALYEDFKVHYSDICTYINPDRDFETAKTLSTFGGLLALDHFYLRSPTTAFLKIFVNCCTFGLWWAWDANQFWFEKEHVLNYGLNYLLDYERGIGRGTMLDGKKPEFVPKKDFMTFMTLAIFFGLFGLDRMYLGGDFVLQGWAKFLSCFILIGLIWVLHDMFMVLAQPNVVLDDGYPVPLPFNTILQEYTGWDNPKSKYVGDLFQVTLDPTEKQTLAEAAAAEAGGAGAGAGAGGLAALAKSKMGGLAAGGLGKFASLAKSAAALTPAGRLASAAGVLRQRGGGEEDVGGATKMAFTAVLLGIGGLAGYSFYKSQT